MLPHSPQCFPTALQPLLKLTCQVIFLPVSGDSQWTLTTAAVPIRYGQCHRSERSPRSRQLTTMTSLASNHSLVRPLFTRFFFFPGNQRILFRSTGDPNIQLWGLQYRSMDDLYEPWAVDGGGGLEFTPRDPSACAYQWVTEPITIVDLFQFLSIDLL